MNGKVLPLALFLCAFQAPPPTPAAYRVLALSESVFPTLVPYHFLRRFQETAILVQIPPGVPIPACVRFEGANGLAVHAPVQSALALGGGTYQLGTEPRFATALPGKVRITAEHHAVDLDLVGQLGKLP